MLTYALTYAQVLTMPLSRTPRVVSTPRAAENTPCTTPPPSAAATPRFLPRANYMAEMPLLMHLTSQVCALTLLVYAALRY
jgi:hypothetical protein